MSESIIDKLTEDSIEMDAYISEFCAVRHEGKQKSIIFDGLPCSTFVEIANDTFIKEYKGCFMEVRNVEIFSQLSLDCEKYTEIRTVIKKEKDHLKFIITSSTCAGEHGKYGNWKRHAKGLMCKANKPDMKFELKNIKKRCTKVKKERRITAQTGKSTARETWDFWIYTYLGEEESLLMFDFPGEMCDSLRGCIMQPGIADCVVDTAIGSLAETGWKAVSYDSLSLYKVIPDKFYVHIKKAEVVNRLDNCKNEFGFDIVLADNDENVFMEIKNYRIIYNDLSGNDDVKRKISLAWESEFSRGENIYGYSTVKHGRVDDNVSLQKNLTKFVSNLSWRQMDCRDRSLALLLGQFDDRLINYFKFFLGAKKGYDLNKNCCFSKPDNWAEALFRKNIFDRMGYRLNINEVGLSLDIQKYLSDILDSGKSACVWLDEYYLFYTQFYLNSHTRHIAVVNGYNKDKKLYSIYDHNHLMVNNNSPMIDCGQFYCTSETLEKIYSNLSREQRIVVTLDELHKNRSLEMYRLRDDVISILSSLLESQHPGKDIDTVCSGLGGKVSLEVGNIDELYKQIGGKELFLDTIVKYFCNGYKNNSALIGLANKIISNSNKLVNSYIVSMYREEALSSDEVLNSINIIRKFTSEFFVEVHSYLSTLLKF